MATRKAKPAAEPEIKVVASKPPAQDNVSNVGTASPSGANMQRLLREAAWSRMFGRTEAKNPFTR